MQEVIGSTPIFSTQKPQRCGFFVLGGGIHSKYEAGATLLSTFLRSLTIVSEYSLVFGSVTYEEMTTLSIPQEREIEYGQGLRKVAEIARIVVAVLGLTGFLIVLFVLSNIIVVPLLFILLEFYGWQVKRENRSLSQKLPSFTQKEKIKLVRRIGNDVQRLDELLLQLEPKALKGVLFAVYFWRKINSIRELGFKSKTTLVEVTYHSAESLGLSAEEADRIRKDLSSFEADWDSEDMDVYDEIVIS